MTTISPPAELFQQIKLPENLKLFGPGPTNVHPRVAEAESHSPLPPMFPQLNLVMESVRKGLQYAFQTRSEYTWAIAGSGHAGMECSIVNVVERGDRVLIGENGIWGQRAADMASRIDADVRRMVKPIGQVFALDEIEMALKEHQPVAFFLTQGESSGGTVQPLEGIGRLCHKYNCLLIVDAVASLGAVPLLTDEWEIDVVYGGSQKALSAPVGMAPISFSSRAWKRITERKTKPCSFFFDAISMSKALGIGNQRRAYHTTMPSHSLLGLREALIILAEEGLEKSWERHQRVAEKLWENVEKLGMELLVADKAIRLVTVSPIKIPPHITNWQMMLSYLPENHDIQILGGLGPSAGKVWRVGLMGMNCTLENADLLANALAKGIKHITKHSSL